MTPRQMQTLRQWWPAITVIFTAGVLWATLRDDVRRATPASRFEADSLRKQNQIDANTRRIERLEASVDSKLDALCRALAANCPPR